MKSIRILSATAICFFLMQITFAQPNPTISKEYSNEEVTRMIKEYKVSNSHDVIPPAMLQQKFQTDFPGTRDVEWETNENIYEVEFEIQYKDYKAYYDTKANLLMYVQEIYRSELPVSIRKVAQSKYPKYALEDIEKIRRGSDVFYKVEMENEPSNMEVKLLIKEDGTILNETFDY
jgi:hypothetical protein